MASDSSTEFFREAPHTRSQRISRSVSSLRSSPAWSKISMPSLARALTTPPSAASTGSIDSRPDCSTATGQEDLTAPTRVDRSVVQQQHSGLREFVAPVREPRDQGGDELSPRQPILRPSGPSRGARPTGAGDAHRDCGSRMRRITFERCSAAYNRVARPVVGVGACHRPEGEARPPQPVGVEPNPGRVAEPAGESRDALALGHRPHHRFVEHVVRVVAGFLATRRQHIEDASGPIGRWRPTRASPTSLGRTVVSNLVIESPWQAVTRDRPRASTAR